MPAFNKFDIFTKDKNEGKHDMATHQLVVALCAVAPVAGNTVLANLTQVAYTFCSSRNITLSSSAQASGVYTLTLTDLTLTATGGAIGPFQYVAVYNDTQTSPADPLIGWYDYGSAVTVNNGETFVIDFGADAGTTGILYTDT